MHLLIVEDNVSDAELTVRQLRAAGIDCTWTRVATEDAFRDALLSAPDLIISDCTLPCFDGISAFSIAAAETPEIPFVFVSGTLGDQRAREALKHGAAGYVAKGNREDLAQTVRSALQRGPSRHRRESDRSPLCGDADTGTGAAQHLLARRRVLDETLQKRDSPAMTSIMLRRAPSPAALVVIEAQLTRVRFAKLLPMANLQIDTAHYFEQQFPREIERAAHLRRPLAVLMADIDHFKRINDQYGHQIGDQVLKEFCHRISDGLRLGRDWVARFGGDEFAVVLPDTTASEACVVADRLCERIRSEAFADPLRKISITASFGVCALDHVPGSGGDLAQRMMRAADAALYESKHRGRNRVTAGCIADTEERLSSA